MIKNNKLLPTLAILTTVVFWGVSTSSIKIALEEVPPATLALIRFIIASSILFTICKIKYSNMKLKKEHQARMITCGAIGFTLYFILENYGVSLISAANAVILLATIPLCTVIAERIVFKVPVGVKKGIGVTLSMIGVILVIANSLSINTSFKELLGSLLMIGASLSWVVYSIMNKKLHGHYSTLFISAYQNIYGTLFLIPFAVLEYNSWQAISTLVWINILYLALFCSALCCFLYLYALKALGAAATNVYINLMPFIGIFAAHIIVGEQLYPLQLSGGIVIVAGVFVVNAQNKTAQTNVVETLEPVS